MSSRARGKHSGGRNRGRPGQQRRPGGADGAAAVSIVEIGALLRRHIVAVLAVLVLALWTVHDFRATPTVYLDGATVLFKPPISARYPNPYEAGGGSIVTAA